MRMLDYCSWQKVNCYPQEPIYRNKVLAIQLMTILGPLVAQVDFIERAIYYLELQKRIDSSFYIEDLLDFVLMDYDQL